ncbi:MAG: iron-sulfur cluster assembly scaffold protein [Gemmatimonadetes bacterium]|nr:iron-sulfur cluster assembly scaffold protein [Gemmatimonadota bacterium]
MTDLSEGYSDIAIDHFEHPRNVGAMDEATVVGSSENPASGASLELYFKLDEQGIVDRVTFMAHGCAAAIAAGSVSTELLKGRQLDKGITRDELAEALDGLPPSRKHAYRLVTDAVQDAAASVT